MLEKRLTIINKLGLHARAAAKLVSTTSGFSSDIKIYHGERQADAKSIMSVMMLAASKGTELKLELDGADANEAFLEIEALVNRYFDEGE